MKLVTHLSEIRLDNHEKLSLETCKSILNRNGLQYTDTEIELIRDFLYQLAEISLASYERNKMIKTIPLYENTEHEQKESIPLYPCEHRRAS